MIGDLVAIVIGLLLGMVVVCLWSFYLVYGC